MRGLAVRPSWYPKYVPKAGDGCVLYCPGQDDPQSAVLRDISGNRNNGTITGATWVREASGIQALSFDGTDDKLVIPHHASLNPLTFTLLMWIYLTARVDWTFIANKGDGDGWNVAFNDGNNLYFTAYNTVGGAGWTNPQAIALNKWVHFACSLSTDVEQWVDGVAAGAVSGHSFSGTFSPTATDLTFMMRGAGFIGGRLGLIEFISGSRNTAQIIAHRNQTRHLFGV
jgi:hypothetical protein